MSAEQLDIEALLEKLRNGDLKALAALFDQYRERLWRIVHFRMDRRLAGRVDADDILQESYMNAADRIDHFVQTTEQSFFIWLRLVVNQTLIDVHRRHLGTKMRDARRDMSLHGRQQYPLATSTSLAAQLLGRVTSPSQVAIRDETAGRLEQAIQGMEPIDQEVLALRHFEELTNSEVAEVLGIQQKAASIRYIRALKRLKQVLGELPEFGEEI